ncbi:MAG: mechanosensitive ion channel [Bryobacteraceae bacterium]
MLRDISTFWERSLFHIGDLSITLAFITKGILFLFGLAFVARRAGGAIRRWILDRSSLGEGQKYAIERTVGYAVFSLGLLIGLNTAGVNLSSLAVLGGALGIGIGFGLQAITTNFVSGLILLLERPVKIGDRVEIDGLNGVIVQIGGRSTWVRTNDNIVIVIPNSDFITARIINWTANDARVRFRLPVGVSYSSDPEQVRSVLLQVAAANPDVLNHPPPDIIFNGFGDSSLDFELRVWTETKVQVYPVLKSDLYFAIFAAFRQAGIEIPFPQRDLHIRSVQTPIPWQREA